MGRRATSRAFRTSHLDLLERRCRKLPGRRKCAEKMLRICNPSHGHLSKLVSKFVGHRSPIADPTGKKS
eukprot:7098799-Prymnesium_polylepis.1